MRKFQSNILAAAFIGAAVLWSAPSVAGIGKIKTLNGEVQIIRNGKTLIGKPGDDLEQADTVVTAADSGVGIIFVDNTKFSAGPNSTIELTRFRFNARKRRGNAFHAKVKRGTLSVISGSIAKKYPGAMTVKTPATILGVRGTRFLIKVGG